MSNAQLILNLDSAVKIFEEILNDRNFLSGNYVPHAGEEVVYDKDKAAYFATSQDAQDTDPSVAYWTGILESENELLNSTNIKMELLDDGKEIVSQIDAATSRITEKIKEKVKFLELPDEFSDVISENFYVFVNELTFFKRLCTFQERLSLVYKNGGVPCGWRGDFPNGRLMIFCKNASCSP